MKKAIAIILAVLVMSIMAACSCGGSDTKGDTKSTTSEAETTKVIETTPDGGTIEQDKDGNVIEKDQSGEIVSVKDSEGNSVDVEQYKAEHKTSGTKSNNSKSATSSAGSGKTSSKTSSASSGNNSSKSSGKSSSKTSSKSSSKSGSFEQETDDATEGEIPTIVVTMPENLDDLPEIPDM